MNIAGGKRSSQRLVTDTTGTLSSDEEYTTKEINDLVDVLLAQDYWQKVISKKDARKMLKRGGADALQHTLDLGRIYPKRDGKLLYDGKKSLYHDMRMTTLTEDQQSYIVY